MATSARRATEEELSGAEQRRLRERELARITEGTGESTNMNLVNAAKSSCPTSQTQTPQGTIAQGTQFNFIAATVAAILCENLTNAQINLLQSFLSVITICMSAIQTVENPS
ncbi:hypothetical protein V6615_00790 [Oscillospiraceae bacterium PP1C4]